MADATQVLNSFRRCGSGRPRWGGERLTRSLAQLLSGLPRSRGAACFPEDGDEETTLFKAADVALYRVKRAGGNGWERLPGAGESMSEAQTSERES